MPRDIRKVQPKWRATRNRMVKKNKKKEIRGLAKDPKLGLARVVCSPLSITLLYILGLICIARGALICLLHFL